jgi:hypothetical protein
MTYCVILFGKNRARSALFFTRDKSTSPEGLQQIDKTRVICR